MKTSNYLLLAAFAGLLIIGGCGEDDVLSPRSGEATFSGADVDNMKKPVRRAWRDSFDTWYQFIPDFEGGWDPNNPFVLAWVPGGGEGNATHMGKVNTFFNQYITAEGNSIGAPVTMFFGDALSLLGFTNIPDEVNSLDFDTKGNSVWFQSMSNTAIPVGPTRINFFGTANIIGGTGKFEGATGEVDFYGFYNPQDPQDAAYWNSGWIEY